MFLRILLVLTVAVSLLTGCSNDGAPTPTAAASPIPVERLNTAQMVIPRINFCSLVPQGDVDAALGSKRWQAEGWENGETVPLTSDRQDVGAEHLCEWVGKDGSTARAWTFARPVTAAFARTVARSERRTPRCRTPSVPAFGKPSVLQICQHADGMRVRRAGLFQDTWFACELKSTGARAGVRERADQWCGSLVSLLNTTR